MCVIFIKITDIIRRLVSIFIGISLPDLKLQSMPPT